MKNVLRRLFCKGCQQFLFTIFFLPNHHISYNTSCFRLDIAVFSKEIEDNAFFFGGGGGGWERRGQIRCIIGSVQMVNYSLGKRCIYHLESTIWIKDSISRSHSLTRVKNWTLSALLHKVSKETTRNFAFCACPNFASWYFASESEGRKVYDL